MGLRDEVTADIKEAFDTDLADAVKPFTGSRTVQGEPSIEDILTNTVGSNSTIINYSGRGVFSSYAEIEVDNESIQMNDVKLIVLQDEVTDTPKLDDVINGYQVVAVNQDPVSVTFTIQLRKV
ncbi:hypothetical protein ACLWP4_001246 [Campylobacter jejuni]